MITIRRPVISTLDRFLRRQSGLPYSYSGVGQSETGHPSNFQLDDNRVELGQGAAMFAAAKAALRRWAMFPSHWAYIYPPDAPIQTGTTVAMTARVWGLWWRNACRIVYTIDEPRRFGFAYGTLPGHAETGEELFLIEWDAEDRIWYRVRAFSRPRLWLARLAAPVARAHQRKFIRDSKKAMVYTVKFTAT